MWSCCGQRSLNSSFRVVVVVVVVVVVDDDDGVVLVGVVDRLLCQQLCRWSQQRQH